MFHKFALLAAPALAGLGMMGCVASAGQASSNDEALRCEIQATSSGGMVALEAMVEADAATTGSYTFHVRSAGGGGSSNIRQGGAFAAGPDGTVTLGRVMLGGSASDYDVSLTLEADGRTIECGEEDGGFL